MDWIVNSIGDEWQFILFEFMDRRWEIAVDLDLSNDDIENYIDMMKEKLTRDILEYGDLDSSDLFIDYTKNKLLS